MPDPNAKLVKELKDLTRALEDNTKELKEANRLKKREARPTAFVTYEGAISDDDSAAVQEPVDSSDGGDESGTDEDGDGTSSPS